MNKHDFGNDFVWGVSTAAYQIEGAVDVDGKGPSIWDHFSSHKGKIKNGEDARTACGFYYRYAEDLRLMKTMHIRDYRFSISWSRIFPKGIDEINPAGILFYNRVIDECIRLEITPWVTLYHWDLPQALEDLGGWTNRAVLDWFEIFAATCIEHFGDRVKHWMVLNEPVVFTGAGYFFGKHAPGRWGIRNYLPAVHHATLAMGRIGRLIRKMQPDARIGTTFSHSPLVPISLKSRHIKAVKRADAVVNRLFIEPILGMGYPMEDVKALRAIKQYMLPGDETSLAFDFDFIGIQTYTREVIQYSLLMPYVWANIVEPKRRGIEKTTLMNWEIYPPSIYDAIKRIGSYPGIPDLYITENGAAFADRLEEGSVADEERKQYLQDHIAQVLEAKKAGYPVKGYFVWTFTDNFEWAEGFSPRFGLVYVDFKTQERTIKDSGKWYAHFIQSQEDKSKS